MGTTIKVDVKTIDEAIEKLEIIKNSVNNLLQTEVQPIPFSAGVNSTKTIEAADGHACSIGTISKGHCAKMMSSLAQDSLPEVITSFCSLIATTEELLQRAKKKYVDTDEHIAKEMR